MPAKPEDTEPSGEKRDTKAKTDKQPKRKRAASDTDSDHKLAKILQEQYDAEGQYVDTPVSEIALRRSEQEQ